MIFGPRLEPDHRFEDYIIYGDDEDFIQPNNNCIFDEDDERECSNCGHCEDKTFACSEDEYLEKDDNDNY